MNNLKSKIENKRSDIITFLVGGESRKIKKNIEFDIDEDVTPFQKAYIKDYSLREVFSFSDDYGYLIDFELMDYGYPIGDDYYERNYGNGELNFYVADYDNQKCTVTLSGSICADIMTISGEGVAKFLIRGVKKNIFKKLSIHQELILEAERLYASNNLKMSFFVYFSALEAVISCHIENYKAKIHKELHYALEHLSLDEKLRVVVKELHSGEDISKIQLWSALAEVVKDVKDKRNLIAHAKKTMINEGDIKLIIFALLLLIGFLEFRAETFNEINRVIFPR